MTDGRGVVDWSAMPWEPMRQGIGRKVFSGQGATLQLARLQPGHAIRPHEHPYEQIVHILAGVVDFHVGDEVYRMKSGACMAVPPNVKHYAVVVGDEEVLNLDVFVPRRADLE